MKPEPIIIGNVYTVTDPAVSEKFTMIGRCTQTVSCDPTRYIANFISMGRLTSQPNKYYAYNEWCMYNTAERKYRLSTQEEINWLNACIKADKFIPKEEAQNTPKPVSRFIVGKWYKKPNGELPYGKLTAPYDGIGNFPSTEYISSSGNYLKRGSFFMGWEDAIEVPLSKVERYLPAGHPDKVSPIVQRRESLLEEAKRRYPHDTEFHSAYSQTTKSFRIDENDRRTYTFYQNTDNIDGGLGKGYLYYQGKWAEIIGKPEATFFERQGLSQTLEAVVDRVKERKVATYEDVGNFINKKNMPVQTIIKLQKRTKNKTIKLLTK